MKEITLYNLPKHSLNEIYAGKHWTKRKKIKDAYKLIIQNQFKEVLSKDKTYRVCYHFNFNKSPLDVSNTVYMLKMIEDIIFEDDSYKIITDISIKVSKANNDFVNIKIFDY